MTTCVPVQLDQGEWRSAVFFELGGKECKEDRCLLHAARQPLPVSLEADLIECASAAVVMLRFEILTRAESPLAGEVLVAPGLGNIHFETISNLTRQQVLDFFFGDGVYSVIYAQQVLLQDRERQGYQSILDDAIRHDAMIRLTGRYDAMTALKEVIGNYAKRKS